MQRDDPHWSQLTGGYQVAYDPRPALAKLEQDFGDKTTWEELWQELYHQGDVGSASYAAVPAIVALYTESNILDWNPYALIATIELARDSRKNIEVPDWLQPEYEQALRSLCEIGIKQLAAADTSETVCSILAVIAISKGERGHARLLVEYTADEIEEILANY
jgi:hypothetical protein